MHVDPALIVAVGGMITALATMWRVRTDAETARRNLDKQVADAVTAALSTVANAKATIAEAEAVSRTALSEAEFKDRQHTREVTERILHAERYERRTVEERCHELESLLRDFTSKVASYEVQLQMADATITTLRQKIVELEGVRVSLLTEVQNLQRRLRAVEHDSIPPPPMVPSLAP